MYQDYLNAPRPENMPILEDLYNLLRAQDEKEAQYIATALEIYVTGSLNVFNHQSNVDINNRIVCYDALPSTVLPTNPPVTTSTRCTCC